jgi:putative acetyltransferase
VIEPTVRSEEPGDYAAISEIVYAAFLNHPLHPPGALPTEHKVVEALREAGALSLSLVCEEQGEIVGHLAFSPLPVDDENRDWYMLGPVAVRPDRQRAGLGSALIREGLRQMQAQGAAGIALAGDPNYYCRFDFVSRPELILEGVPAEYFLSLPLSGEVPSGRVTMHEAFFVS